MRRKLLFQVIFLATLISLSSCQKIIDRIFNGITEDKTCRITEIKQLITGDSYRTGQVYYNQQGNPDSVIFDKATGSAGAHLFYFHYDDQHRLIEYRGDYSHEADDYYFKHKYYYSNGRVIADTAYVREAGTSKAIHTLEYDDLGRVIKENRLWVEGDGQPVNEVQPPLIYAYNEDGNLGEEGSENLYDDKVSFLRTNKVWMFTQRNYSQNNRLGATDYNQEGLPLGFSASTEGISFLQFDNVSELQYECK